MPALTGLRFFLAVWVMLHHISGTNMMLEAWANSLPQFGQSLIHGGYLAVQTFFILSGFVLARSYRRADWERDDLIRYGAARIARIYPVYLFSLVLVSPFIFETMMRPGRSGAEKGNLLTAYGFLLQGWSTGLHVGWNTPAWTLTCELFFYLCFPVLFPALKNAGWKKLLCVTAAVITAPVLLAHEGVPSSWKPIHHLADFVAGVAAARVYQLSQRRLAGRGWWLYLPALALGIFVIICPQVVQETYGNSSTALRLLNALALVGLALSGGLAARLISTPLFDYLGKVSYSMYILHVPVLWWYSYWAMHGPLHVSMLAATLIYFAIVTGLAAGAFKYIEMPANKWIRSQVDARIAERTESLPIPAAA